MNIYFHASGPKSGLSSNGGSRTILKSAEVLRELGHHVDVIAYHDSFSWFKHPKPIKRVPEGDGVVVAVSAKDVKDAIKYSRGKPVYWWVRGIEKWGMPEEKLIQRASWVKCIVNASHLQDWLKSHGIKSKLCYAGLDDIWEPSDRKRGKPLVVGCLKHKYHSTKRWDLCLALLDKLPFETHTLIHTGEPDKTEEQMKAFYQKCDIWFAPTELEGFHGCPAEAAMCGCLVVGRRDPRGGMRDYLTEDNSHLFDTLNEAVEAVLYPDFSKVPRLQHDLLAKIGSRHRNMHTFAEMICQK